MIVEINGNRLNVEVIGPEGAPVLIAHHGGGGIGSLAEPKATFGPLADRFRAMILRDTSADGSHLELAFEYARNQDRVEINWDNFNRYWSGNIRDDDDLKARWAELIPLYDYEFDPEESAKIVEAGIYRHEAHNWCFKHN
jgi:hypothetical protein